MWWKYFVLFSTTTFYVTISSTLSDSFDIAASFIQEHDKILCNFEKATGLSHCQNWPHLPTDITATARSSSATAPLSTQETEATPSIEVKSRFGEPYQQPDQTPQFIQLRPRNQNKPIYLVQQNHQTAYATPQQRVSTQQTEATPSIEVKSRFGEPYQQPAQAPQFMQLRPRNQNNQLHLAEQNRQTAYATPQQTVPHYEYPPTDRARQSVPENLVANRPVANRQQLQQQYLQQQYAQQPHAQQQYSQQQFSQQQARPVTRVTTPTQQPHLAQAQVSHQTLPIQYQPGPELINNGFTNSLHQIISSHNRATNVVYSPISLQTALALIYTGASGQTAQELQVALNLPPNKRKVLELFQSIPKSQQSGEFILTMVGKLYYNQDRQVLPQFVSDARTYFDAEASPVNFAKPQVAANQINQWAAVKTNQRIRNVVAPEALDAQTSAILVNAIYFKAKWQNEFSADETTNEVFFTPPNQRTEVPMMNNEDTFRYADMPDYHAKVLQLPYKDTDLSMMIILPDDPNGLASVEERFQNYDLRGLLQEVRPENVKVQLPKFHIQFELDMVAALQRLNIKKLFTNGAELYEIFQNSQTGISSVKHKAFLDVNEAGSEAAAVTYTKFIPLSLPSNLKEFRVDHPFMFAIISPQAVYFAGHVVRL